MVIYRYVTGEDDRPTTATTSTATSSKQPVLYTSVAFVAIGLPLLAVAGLTLLLSAAVLVSSSPLLLLFSPLLLLAGLVLAGSLAGFGLAGAAWYGGVWSLGRVFRALGWSKGHVDTEEEWRAVQETLTETRKRMREEVRGLGGGGYSHRRVTVHPPEDTRGA